MHWRDCLRAGQLVSRQSELLDACEHLAELTVSGRPGCALVDCDHITCLTHTHCRTGSTVASCRWAPVMTHEAIPWAAALQETVTYPSMRLGEQSLAPLRFSV